MTNKPNIAVITSFYNGVEPFLADFFTSLNAQTDCSNFDLISVNDGCRDLARYLPNAPRFGLRILPPIGYPLENRIDAIRWAVEAGYTKLIFCDSDDVMISNRMSVSERLLEDHDIVVTELDLWDGRSVFEASFIEQRLGPNFSITAEDVADYNFIGFSNTAIRADCFAHFKTSFGADVLAGDWLFYSALLKEGCSASFSNATRTLYRRYAGNQTCLQPQTLEELKEVLRVRHTHYHYLAKHYVDFQERAELALRQWQRLSSADSLSTVSPHPVGSGQSLSTGQRSLFWWELQPWAVREVT